MADKKKILIIAGHGEGDPGACSIWGQEADYTRELASLLQSALKGKVKVTMYDQTKNCYAQSKQGNVPDYAYYDATVEVHFNAKSKKDPYGDGRFTGAGGYVHPSNAGGRKIAQAIMGQMAAIGFKEWGIFDSTGLLNLNNAQRQGAVYFLLETAFIDDGDDMKWYTGCKEKAAQAIAQGILKGMGLKSRAEEPKPQEVYRVRKSWEDTASQVFAGTREGAVRCCPEGYSVYGPDGKRIYTRETAGLQAGSFKGCSEAGFIEAVGPLYTADQEKNGILACVSLAQAILESGYGQTDLAQCGNNLHGMKCTLSGNTWKGTAWDGSSFYEKESPECINGETIMKSSRFRKYGCIEESISDHAAYLLNAANGRKQRYAGLKGCKDYKKALQIIKGGGYATDPAYVSKLSGIIEKWNLARFNASGADAGEGQRAEPAFEPYMVTTTCNALNIRKGPGTAHRIAGVIREMPGQKNKYTIVREKNGWGKLKSGIGWVCLKYTKKAA